MMLCAIRCSVQDQPAISSECHSDNFWGHYQESSIWNWQQLVMYGKEVQIKYRRKKHFELYKMKYTSSKTPNRSSFLFPSERSFLRSLMMPNITSLIVSIAPFSLRSFGYPNLSRTRNTFMGVMKTSANISPKSFTAMSKRSVLLLRSFAWPFKSLKQEKEKLQKTICSQNQHFKKSTCTFQSLQFHQSRDWTQRRQWYPSSISASDSQYRFEIHRSLWICQQLALTYARKSFND